MKRLNPTTSSVSVISCLFMCIFFFFIFQFVIVPFIVLEVSLFYFQQRHMKVNLYTCILFLETKKEKKNITGIIKLFPLPSSLHV